MTEPAHRVVRNPHFGMKSAHKKQAMMKKFLLVLTLLLSNGFAQTTLTGTVTLNGSVETNAGGKHYVSLSWSAQTGPTITFRIYRSSTEGGPYTEVMSGISTLRYTDLNVPSPATLYYVCTAYDSSTNSESPYSNQFAVNIPN